MNKKQKLGLRISLARKQAGLNQTELAEKVGRTRQALAAWEQNKVAPSLPVLEKLAQATNKPLAFFISDIAADLIQIPVFVSKELYDDLKKLNPANSDLGLNLIPKILEFWCETKK